ncbi:MAG TPA: pepsin/retropepsin-like aspartic protease family protein [Candidatus Rubrimentiphilum sp.]|nr:pepsin/retropepsin-like aspartic protease family protein [Candidatus Rubrimentiphilum sp.]
MAALLVLLTTAAAPPPQLDATSITPAQLLERADKTSGTLAPGSYLRTYTSDGGGLHTEGVTKISGSDRETVEHTGPFTTAFGVFHGQQWRQNENGVVILLSGFHDTADPDANALSHAGSSTDMHVLGITHDAPQQYVLEVAPMGGPRERRYYDAQTYLLNRIEVTGSDGRTRVWTFSRYRPVFNELIAYTASYSDGRPANDSVTQITSFSAAPVSLTGIPASRKLLPASATKPIEIPAIFNEDGIIVPVKIAGRTYNFALDSGSDSLGISPRIAAELGYKRYGLSKADMIGEFDVSQTVVPDLAIGDLHLTNAVFSVIPIDQPDDKNRIVGVLGLDFWSSAIVGIDFKDKTVTLYPADTSPPDAASLSAMPIELDDGVPRAPASVEGVQGYFVLDTGSASTIFYRHYFDQLRTKTPLEESLETRWLGGIVDMAGYSVDDFAMGPAQFKHASVALPPSGSNFDSDYDGIIGRNIMEYYKMYFDYEGHAVYLRPNV